MKINFCIEHLDPLGQGVSKSEEIDEKGPKPKNWVTFIKKTLPEETGSAVIYSQKKGVRFAQCLEITKNSPLRIAPECPHYKECNGCDYQHTSYESEILFKKQALERHLQKFEKVEISIHKAPHRFHYRNRIQLHYDKKKKSLGLLNELMEIVPVRDCLIIDPSIAFELRSLYQENSWLGLVLKEPPTGHIELYIKEKSTRSGHSVQVSVNHPYAKGGFTQVNFKMNQVLLAWVSERAQKLIPPKAYIYDLFGGDGNLTAQFKNPTLVVDKYRTPPQDKGHQKFFSCDLYDKSAIKNLIGLKAQGILRPQWLIIDPPRSGLKNLGDFLAEFKPDGFFYIACQATSFARDTFPILKNYELKSIELFDLFPSTQHFETIGIFTKRKKND